MDKGCWGLREVAVQTRGGAQPLRSRWAEWGVRLDGNLALGCRAIGHQQMG